MARITDVEHGDWLDLPGECECPGRPHPTDRVQLRKEGGYGVLSAVAIAGATPEGLVNTYEQRIRLVCLMLMDWNLQDAQGVQQEVTEYNIRRLDEGTLDWIAEQCDDRIRRTPPLPNGFGAPSVTSSPESASSSPEAVPTSS